MIADTIEEYFKKLRFDKNHHLGLGDIRLTIGQQEEIVEIARNLPNIHTVQSNYRPKYTIEGWGEHEKEEDECKDL